LEAILKRLAAMFCALATQACAEPASVGAYMGQPQVKADATITYGRAPAQVVDLFLPKTGGRHPVVILLHGGCYLAEYEGLPQTSGIAADLARRGYAVWNVDYRKFGETGAGYPGTFLDVADAVDRLKTEAAKYRLDLTRVVALGHSAGGQLALWAASRPKIPRESPLWRADPVRVRAVVSVGGIGDLGAHAGSFDGACGAGTIARITDGHYADTSPALLLPSGARVVMVHGQYDHVMPPPTGRAYVETVRRAGDPAEVVALDGFGHFDAMIPTTPAWATVADIVTREIAGLN
jgi:acetyl esterase/lipase